MTFAAIIGWAPLVSCAGAIWGCVALRSLLTDTLPIDKLRTLSPALAAVVSNGTFESFAANRRAAQRGNWAAMAYLAVVMALSTRTVAFFLEEHVVTGVAWVVAQLAAMAAALAAADVVIYGSRPPDWWPWGTKGLILLNRASFAVCAVVLVIPWFVEPPPPRGPALSEFISYYPPIMGSFVSACGACAYFVIGAATIGVSAWRASRREADRSLRRGLQILTAAELAVLTIVVPQLVLTWSGAHGEPVLDQFWATVVLIIGLTLTVGLSVMGATWAPLILNHRARVAAFLVPLWREDVEVLRPVWLELRQLYDEAYEPQADERPARSASDLQIQRRRIAVDINASLIMAGTYLSPAGRERALRLAGGPVALDRVRHGRRLLAGFACRVLPHLGVIAPGPARRLWRRATEAPLADFAVTDTACVLAAVRMHESGMPGFVDASRVMTPEPYTDDELVGYLRRFVAAREDEAVQEAGLGAFVSMSNL